MDKMIGGVPRIAVIDPNTLAALGLRHILQDVMPVMVVDTFGSISEIDEADIDSYFHYFASMSVVMENRQFFISRCQKTIVLTASQDSGTQLSDFHSLCVNVPESQLILSILTLEQHAHAHGRNLPPMPKNMQQKILSDREIDVLSLIVQGYINKEIADRLNICMTTVITHRKNIMDKLGMKSVSALTIYAVMHGYVDVEKVKK